MQICEFLFISVFEDFLIGRKYFGPLKHRFDSPKELVQLYLGK